MAKTRAIMTETERERIAGRADVADTKRYQAISRVRGRVQDELATDVEILREHHPDLFEELRAVVCDDIAVEGSSAAGERPPREPATTDAGADRGDEGGEDTATPSGATDGALTELQAAVDGLDLPGSGEKLQRRRDAVRACLDYLAENESATPSDFRDNVYPDHPSGYTTGQDPPRSWWKNCVYKGLRQLAEDDDRLRKADTAGVWTLDT